MYGVVAYLGRFSCRLDTVFYIPHWDDWVCENEIDRWMQPEWPLKQAISTPISTQLTQSLVFLKQHEEAKNAERWNINFQTNERGQENLALNWSLPAVEGG